MTTLNISIPDSMKAYVEAQAAAGGFTASEYIRHLIRIDQEQQQRRAQIARYLGMCEEQIARGEGREWDAKELLGECEKEYKRRYKKRS